MRAIVIVVVWLLPLVMFAFRPEAAAKSDTYADSIATVIGILGALQVMLGTVSIFTSIRTGQHQRDSLSTTEIPWRAKLSKFCMDLAYFFVIPFLIF